MTHAQRIIYPFDSREFKHGCYLDTLQIVRRVLGDHTANGPGRRILLSVHGRVFGDRQPEHPSTVAAHCPELTYRYTRRQGFNQDTLEYFLNGNFVDGGRVMDLEPGRLIARLEDRGLTKETAARVFHDAEALPPGCAHERLDMDGACRACGVDCRGIA